MGILRHKEMQLRSDVSPMAPQYRNYLLTKACWMLKHCIENRVGFEYASRKEDVMACLKKSFLRAHGTLP